MPEKAQIRHQVEFETERRATMGTIALVAGALLLAGTVVTLVASGSQPQTGLLQGFGPLLHGQANPRVSPRYELVQFYNSHAAQLIGASVAAAFGFVGLAGVIHFLSGAVRFRRPESMRAAGPIVLYVPPMLGLVSVGAQVSQAILAHKFLHGHNFDNHAADHALGHAPVTIALGSVSLFLGLVLLVGLGNTSLNAMRTGLITRGMGYVGMFVAVFVLLGFGPIGEIVPGLWMLALGAGLHGVYPRKDPPAWATGLSVPWPTLSEERELREQERIVQERGGKGKAAAEDDDVAPEPVPVGKSSQSGGSRSKRRKGRGGSRR
ncbi:MAG TPA: hypothetical protein VHX88_15025 [Solirubrobacteraceae bacterium]|jgi:hypothetical protein|nr:hypothetical protein [Solirubrobacteraceae bacterium]